MRAVNLLPSGSESRKSFRKEDPAVVVGSVLGLVVLFALVAGFLNVHSKVNGEQKKLTAARSELAKLSLSSSRSSRRSRSCRSRSSRRPR